MNPNVRPLQGAGLGLRRSLMMELAAWPVSDLPHFFELAPENWLGMGGRYAKQLAAFSEQHTLVAHGLSLSLGGQRPLDKTFLSALKGFLQQHHIRYYSEHLSYSDDQGHLYDLLPIPFTPQAVRYVAERIQQVQDILGQRLIIENVSYYAAPSQEMTELEFLLAVLAEADCELLLDVNNVFVNSINHCYNPYDFILALPKTRIRYLHIAGHYVEDHDLRIDTHGDAVIDDVWQLLAFTYQNLGVYPTLLERDFNIPPLAELMLEVNQITHLMEQAR